MEDKPMLQWKTIFTFLQGNACIKLQELLEDGTFRVVMVKNGKVLYSKVFPCPRMALSGFQEGLRLIKSREKTELIHSL
ncbi:MAG: hypothetical protein Q6354_07960 [Candidatus Brocadiales bacterium]|nr:hypothetical protein [Candidatus Brocadiales bacterium]